MQTRAGTRARREKDETHSRTRAREGPKQRSPHSGQTTQCRTSPRDTPTLSAPSLSTLLIVRSESNGLRHQGTTPLVEVAARSSQDGDTPELRFPRPPLTTR